MKKKTVLIIVAVVVLVLIIAGILGLDYYKKIYSTNIDLKGKDSTFLYIRTGAQYSEVFDSLTKKDILIDKDAFDWVAEKKKYKTLIKPGRYTIQNGLTNNELINMLRSGKQTPVKVTFNNIRTKDQLAGKISRLIEADSITLLNLLNDNEFVSKYGFDKRTIIGMFIPNSYYMNWNTTSKKFLDKMFDEYKRFWNNERIQKASQLKFSKNEVATLASIVQAEQSMHNDEKAKIAGLYINRLKKNIPLQSDPTLIYAIGDYNIRRVLNRHKEVNSPYNTYKHTGLPPSPINIPEISSIDAVLNFEKHDYIYMCAKEDFSGYHYFSKSLNQHNAYAKKYQAALDKNGIKK